MVTVKLKPLGGRDKAALKEMMDEVERFYSTFISRVVRKPNSVTQKAYRPILIAVPDRPVFKYERQQLKNTKINDGVHVHGILLVPMRSRLKERVKRHFKTHEHCYIRNNLLRLKVQPIQSNPQEVVDYVFKSVKTSYLLAMIFWFFQRPRLRNSTKMPAFDMGILGL